MCRVVSDDLLTDKQVANGLVTDVYTGAFTFVERDVLSRGGFGVNSDLTRLNAAHIDSEYPIGVAVTRLYEIVALQLFVRNVLDNVYPFTV